MQRLLGCVADLNQAVEGEETATPHAYGFRRCSREELARLGHDGLAQVLSYVPPSYIPTLPGRFSPSLNYHTLSAVSPRTRLYAEALVNHSSTDADFEGVQVSEGAMRYWIVLRGRSPNLTRLQLSLWWSERCGVPVVLYAPNACSRLLALLSARWRRNVWHLRLLMRATLVSDSADSVLVVDDDEEEIGTELEVKEEEEEEWGRREQRVRWEVARQSALHPWQSAVNPSPVRLSCSTFLRALPTFPNLCRLEIAGEYAADPVGAAAAAISALRIVQSKQSVEEVELWNCGRLRTLSSLAGAACLQRLVVHGCGIADLEGLSWCRMLAYVDVSENAFLTDLSGLGGAPRLRSLTARNCAVVAIDKLNDCPVLKYLDVSGNTSLSSLRSLRGAPRLQELVLSCTAVADVEVLLSCPSLMMVDVRGCRNVRTTASLLQLDVLADEQQR